MEVWKDIKGFKGYYQVSSLARVRSLDRIIKQKPINKIIDGKLLTVSVHPSGYHYVNFHREGRVIKVKLHRLVALHFVRNPNNYPDVNHQDGIKANCLPSNLKWVTKSQNQKHAFAIGLNKGKKGSANPLAKLTEVDVITILQMKGIKPINEIAALYNVNRRCIKGILEGKSWRHVTGPNLQAA